MICRLLILVLPRNLYNQTNCLPKRKLLPRSHKKKYTGLISTMRSSFFLKEQRAGIILLQIFISSLLNWITGFITKNRGIFFWKIICTSRYRSLMQFPARFAWLPWLKKIYSIISQQIYMAKLGATTSFHCDTKAKPATR